MKITTHDIIKMLPFDPEFKDSLLASWESLSIDQKNAIGNILWDEYSALYELNFKKNIDIAMAEIAEGKGKLDDNFKQRVREQTQKDMQVQFSDTVPEANLAETREALQDILNNPSSNSN